MRVENENQWEPFNGASWPIKGLNIKCNNSLQFGYFRHDHIRKSCIIWVYYGLWTLSGENKVTNTSFSCCASLSTSIHPDTRVLSIIHHLGPSLTSGSRLWMSPEDEWTVDSPPALTDRMLTWRIRRLPGIRGMELLSCYYWLSLKSCEPALTSCNRIFVQLIILLRTEVE